MGYSTSPDLQRMFKYCFVFQCSDGQRYQFGVSYLANPTQSPAFSLTSLSCPLPLTHTRRSRIRSPSKDGLLHFRLPCLVHLKSAPHTRETSEAPVDLHSSPLLRIVDVPLTSALIAQAKQEFNKQLEVYHGIESADKELFIAACKDGSIGKSQEISG
jgi:hypothetical protein